MNNKVLVLTGTTDIIRKPEETDLFMEEVFEITLPSKQRYAKKHGYDLLTLRSFGQDKNKIFHENHIGFLRALRSFEMLEYYDTVMWIDADAIITNDNYKIENFEVDETHSFYASYDWAWKQTFSTGNFIIKKTEKTKELFNAFLSVGNYVVKTKQWGEEQTTLNLIHNGTDVGKTTIKVLEHKFLNSIPTREMFLGKWDGREIPYPWSEDSFLAHITGICNQHRVEILLNSFKKYL